MRTNLEIADIFRAYAEEYKQTYKLTKLEAKVITDITACRTAKLGGHVEICEDCGHERISYNSCRNRHCPKCQFVKKEQWVLDKEKDVLPVEYFHVVFTLPDKLNQLTYRNKQRLYNLLLKCAGQTLTELGEEIKWFNGKTGAICVLHSWGQKLDLHPHVHCIVPGGALSLDKTEWKACRRGYFLPVKVLSKRFRRLFIDKLKQLYKKKQLFLEGSLAQLKGQTAWQSLIDKLYATDWVAYAKKPFRNVGTVIQYLSRYTHRIAISNYRLVKLEAGYVYFTYRDYRDNNQQKLMRLTALEFMRRFLTHVLPPRLVKIRYFGLLSNRTREANIALCRVLLNVKPEDIPVSREYVDFADFLLDVLNFDVRKCPVCKGKLVNKADVLAQNYIRAP